MSATNTPRTTRAPAPPATGPAMGPAIRESVERVYLAGLGAAALTGDEGARLFRTLVDRGAEVDARVRERVNRVLATAREVPAAAATRAGARVEAMLDEGTEAVLTRVGLPTRREVTTLARRVDGLSEAIGTPRRRRSPVTRATAKARPPRRTATAAARRATRKS